MKTGNLLWKIICMTSHLKHLDSHPYSVGWSHQSWMLWSHQECARGENQGRRVSALGVHKMSANFQFHEHPGRGAFDKMKSYGWRTGVLPLTVAWRSLLSTWWRQIQNVIVDHPSDSSSRVSVSSHRGIQTVHPLTKSQVYLRVRASIFVK